MIQTNERPVLLHSRGDPHLRARKGGYIFNVSSLAGRNAFPNAGAYCASKHAVNGFSEVLFREVRNDDIRVTYLMPGSVATDFDRRGEANRTGAAGVRRGRDGRGPVASSPRALHSRVEMRPAKPQKG